MKSNQKSFTVIELLVVIAIIGLVSSIVLVSVRGARERARIAATKQFSDSLRASLSDALVSWWSFDEGVGPTVGDTWGGNTGTISGASWTKGVAGDALSFNGDYVEAPIISSLNTGKVTVEVWVESIGSTGTRQSVVSIGEDSLTGAVLAAPSENGDIRFWINEQTAGWRPVYTAFPGYNQWLHVVGTYDGNYLEIYVNGELKNTVTLTGSMKTPTSDTNIGSRNSNDGHFFNGIIDEVRIYSRGLTALEIQKRYAEGLKKYKLVEK